MTTITRRELLQRSALIASGLVAGPALVGACTSTQSEVARTGRVTGNARVLVGFGTGNEPSQASVQEAVAKAFARAHPGASVTFNRVPDSDTAQQKFTLQLVSHTAPDVVLPIGIFGISTFLDKNVWLDLSPYLSASGVSLDDFQAPASRAARAVAYYGDKGNTVVGLPSGMFTHTVGYNKDLFAQAGIPEPPHEWDTPDWTYDKLLEVATALTKDGQGRTPDQAGFDPQDIKQFGLGHWDTGIMTLGYGAHNYDPASRKVTFDTAEYVAGIQAGIDLTNKYHVLATDQLASAVSAGASDPQQSAWQSGKVAMVDLCSCDLPSYGIGNTFQWDIAAWPKGPQRMVATLNLDVGAIPAPSNQHDLSWEVLREFLTVPQNTRTLVTRGYGAIPALKSESSAFIPSVRSKYPGIDLKVFIDAIPYCSPETEEWYPAFNEIGALSTLQPLYDGKVSAAEIMPVYQQQAQALVDKWFSTHELPH